MECLNFNLHSSVVLLPLSFLAVCGLTVRWMDAKCERGEAHTFGFRHASDFPLYSSSLFSTVLIAIEWNL